MTTTNTAEAVIRETMTMLGASWHRFHGDGYIDDRHPFEIMARAAAVYRCRHERYPAGIRPSYPEIASLTSGRGHATAHDRDRFFGFALTHLTGGTGQACGGYAEGVCLWRAKGGYVRCDHHRATVNPHLVPVVRRFAELWPELVPKSLAASK